MGRLPKKRSKVRSPLALAGFFLCIGVAFYVFVGFPDTAAYQQDFLSRYSMLPPFKGGDRVAIVAPHLDDETLGVGGLIAQLREQGIAVSVVFMTNGDDNPIGADLLFKTGYPSPTQLIESGSSRQKEAVKALAKLGVAEDQLYFLGLPDRGLQSIYSPDYRQKPYKAPGTLQTTSPYPNTYIKQLPYSGEATHSALLQVLNSLHPTLVLTTAVFDRHSDHSATAHFVTDVLPEINSRPQLAYFLIHYARFPRPKGNDEKQALLPPRPLEKLPWEVVYLQPAQELKKKDALSEYQSQLKVPFSGTVLRQFVRKNELVLPK